MVVYFEHLDAMLAALCGENGPFCGCVGGQHNDTGISTPLGGTTPRGYYRSFEHPDDRHHDYGACALTGQATLGNRTPDHGSTSATRRGGRQPARWTSPVRRGPHQEPLRGGGTDRGAGDEPLRGTGDAALADHLPTRFAQITDPTTFFTELGEQVQAQVEELTLQLTGDDPPPTPGEPGSFLDKAARINTAKRMAEERIIPELVLLPSEVEPETEAGTGSEMAPAPR
jgi:hypothetical protein